MTFALDQLYELLGFDLSDEQAAAVTADIAKPLLVVAGAGSGKTSVMAARVIWAVANDYVEPGKVLGLTFTSKAAGELGLRVRSLLDKLFGQPPDDVPAISTYHAFAHGLVAEHGLRLGIEPGSRLLTEYETAALAYDVVVNTRLPLTDLSMTPRSLAKAVISLDQQLAEHVVSTEQLREFDVSMIGKCGQLEKTVAADRELLATSRRRFQLCDLVDELRAAKLSRRVVDFGDLLRFGSLLADRPDVQADLRTRYPLVLLDEYQDTSIVQTRFLSALFGEGHAVTAVGDPLQAIYGWRGASSGAMEEFPQLFASTGGAPATCLDLSISQRCPAVVLDVANEIGAPLRSEAANVVRLTPSMRSDFSADAVRGALFETHSEEVEWLTDEIASQIAGGSAPESVAVLCRASSDFPSVAESLVNRGISVSLSSSDAVLSTPEVLDVVAVLRMLADPGDNASALRILLGPRMRIGPADLLGLGRLASELTRGGRSNQVIDLRQLARGEDEVELASLTEALMSRAFGDADRVKDIAITPAGRDRLAWLRDVLTRLQEDVDLPLTDLVAKTVSLIGLDVEIKLAQLAAANRSQPCATDLADVRSGVPVTRGVVALDGLYRMIDSYASSVDHASLTGFLTWIELVADFDGPTVEFPATPGSVNLMTIHKAKGLEWEVVAVPFLSASVFPTAKSRSKWTNSVAALPHALRGDRNFLCDLNGFGTKAHSDFAAGLREHSDAEERRLAYVAMTRPTRKLLLSGHWWGPTQKTMRGPSVFLTQLEKSSLIGPSVSDDTWISESQFDANPMAMPDAAPAAWPPVVAPDIRERKQQAAHYVESDSACAAGPARGSNLAMETGSVTEAGPVPATGAALAMGSEADAASVLWAEPETEVSPAMEAASAAGVGLTAAQARMAAAWDADIEAIFSATARQPGATPAVLSVTSLEDYLANPRGYQDRINRPMPRPSTAGMTRGTRFHEWVAQYWGQQQLLVELPGIDDDVVLADSELDALKSGFARTEFADRTPIAVEVPFSLSLGGQVVNGRIDAVFTTDDGYQVVDWKTGRAVDHDPLQLAVYVYAWSQLTSTSPDSIAAAYVNVRNGTTDWLADLPSIDSVLTKLTAAKLPS